MVNYNDPAASRRDSFEKCMWWSRDTINDDNSQIIMDTQPTGVFFAKEYSPQTIARNTVGGTFMVESVTVAICTQDNVYGLTSNDIVKYRGELWLVETVQPKFIRQASAQFANVELGSKAVYIRMRKY